MLNSKKTVCYIPSGHIGLDELDIKQLKALANADFMPAVAALGNNYLWGCKGLKADTYKAIELLRKAAGTGDKLANESLGALFYRGHEGLDGVLIQNDKHQAYRVNLKAAKLGSRISQSRLSRILEESPEVAGLSKDEGEKQSAYWCEMAARQGSRVAQGNLACKYRKGMGVEQDDEKALFWESTPITSIVPLN